MNRINRKSLYYQENIFDKRKSLIPAKQWNMDFEKQRKLALSSFQHMIESYCDHGDIVLAKKEIKMCKDDIPANLYQKLKGYIVSKGGKNEL